MNNKKILLNIGFISSILISIYLSLYVKWYYGTIPVFIWLEYRLIAYAIYGYLMKKYEKNYKKEMQRSYLFMQNKAKQLSESVGKINNEGKTKEDI